MVGRWASGQNRPDPTNPRTETWEKLEPKPNRNYLVFLGFGFSRVFARTGPNQNRNSEKSQTEIEPIFPGSVSVNSVFSGFSGRFGFDSVFLTLVGSVLLDYHFIFLEKLSTSWFSKSYVLPSTSYFSKSSIFKIENMQKVIHIKC